MSKLGLVRNLQRRGELDHRVMQSTREQFRAASLQHNIYERSCADLEETLDTRAGLPTVLCPCLSYNHLVSVCLAVSASLHLDLHPHVGRLLLKILASLCSISGTTLS